MTLEEKIFYERLDAKEESLIQVFRNLMKRGFSREEAQAMIEISDELVERAMSE